LAADEPKTSELGVAVQQVSEKVSILVREEIELAKAEVTAKVTTLGRGTVAAIIGAVFAFFWLIFALLTLAWGLNSLLDSVWLGFAIVMALLLLLTVGVALTNWLLVRGRPPAARS
jgi:hypothetical protein